MARFRIPALIFLIATFVLGIGGLIGGRVTAVVSCIPPEESGVSNMRGL
jgi:hypothetical protein